jgi:hypothetical protein
MGGIWRASITRSKDKRHWLVFLDSDVVPAAFVTYADADEYIKEKFGVTGLCSAEPLISGAVAKS